LIWVSNDVCVLLTLKAALLRYDNGVIYDVSRMMCTEMGRKDTTTDDHRKQLFNVSRYQFVTVITLWLISINKSIMNA